MVARLRRPLWTILISLTTIAFVYLTFVTTTIDQDLPKPRTFHGHVKNIVAYSLLKKIEIESEHYACDEPWNNTAINGGAGTDNQRDAWTNIDGGALHVLSVHADRRLDPYHYVRIVGMIRGNLHDTIYCQIQSPSKIVYVAKATITPIWLDIWDQNDTSIYYNPVLLSCRVPFGLAPKSMSVTLKPCEKEQGKYFLLTNDRMNDRLIQWIEIVRILGAGKIEIYVKKVKGKVWKILKWYNSNYPDQVVVREFQDITEANVKENHNFSQILWQKRRYEVATYNSCFYRNIGTAQFIIPLDIDEIILPKYLFTWKNVLRDIFTSFPEVKENFASFMVPNAYFFGKLPKKHVGNIFFLNNILRSQLSPPGESGKSFISTQKTLTVFNHYALDVLKPGVSRTYFLPSSEVQLNHYKETCNAVILPECVKYLSSPRIKDPAALKYEKEFMYIYFKRVSLFKKLGFL